MKKLILSASLAAVALSMLGATAASACGWYGRGCCNRFVYPYWGGCGCYGGYGYSPWNINGGYNYPGIY